MMPSVLRTVYGVSLQHPRDEGLSSLSLLEWAVHHRRGRLQFEGTLRDFFDVGLAAHIDNA